MHEIVLTKTHLALVLEYASGGSLTDEVSCLWESALQRGGLFMEEQEASYHLRQVVNAVAYCHKHRVVHRDLKLDNTLLEPCIVGLPRIKVCDFGFAKRWGAAGDQMHTAIGTPVYMSPQVRMLASRQCKSGYSGVKADMWAVGILLFVMLLGTFPFDHDESHEPNSAEAANEVWLKQQQQGWRKNPRAADVLQRGVLSAECCDLLDRLLEMDEVGELLQLWKV
ncbi:kinase-like domain-containing protein [Scenedesmus sp. NREL 46B-D3]|nr:kinase-like domain-containing protein [Scenedesmus sp. NREL 46B-D3]